MTTTTPAIESIRYTIQTGNLLADGTPTPDAIRRLAQRTAEAIAAAFPGAEVECPVERTSGGRPAGYDVVQMTDPAADDRDVRERATQIADATWQAWCEALTDADMES